MISVRLHFGLSIAFDEPRQFPSKVSNIPKREPFSYEQQLLDLFLNFPGYGVRWQVRIVDTTAQSCPGCVCGRGNFQGSCIIPASLDGYGSHICKIRSRVGFRTVLAHWHTGCLKTTPDVWKSHIKTAIGAAAFIILSFKISSLSLRTHRSHT